MISQSHSFNILKKWLWMITEYLGIDVVKFFQIGFLFLSIKLVLSLPKNVQRSVPDSLVAVVCQLAPAMWQASLYIAQF